MCCPTPTRRSRAGEGGLRAPVLVAGHQETEQLLEHGAMVVGVLCALGHGYCSHMTCRTLKTRARDRQGQASFKGSIKKIAVVPGEQV